MGKIKNALKSVGQNVVIIVVSILTIVFLVMANLVAVVCYPLYAMRKPDKAVNEFSLVELIGLGWLEDIVNPRNRWCEKAFMRFFQSIMRKIDASVVCLWNAILSCIAPMKVRKYYINEMGNGIQSLSEKTQRKYFDIVDKERKIYLVKNNKLSPELLSELYDDNVGIFVCAGKVSDEQFKQLNGGQLRTFCGYYDLSVAKQCELLKRVFRSPEDYGRILHDYIMRKGLHPSAVAYYHDMMKIEDKKDAVDLTTIPATLQARQDLVTVLQTGEKQNPDAEATMAFAQYLEIRKELGEQAQIEMKCWQYNAFNGLGLKLDPAAIRAKLARVNKNDESANFVAKMMEFGELEGNEEAMLQIAGDEKLTRMWLQHLGGVVA